MTFYIISLLIFFFTVPTTSAIYTLSLHDALPIYILRAPHPDCVARQHAIDLAQCLRERLRKLAQLLDEAVRNIRSEEHTSELQSRFDLVCRLLLEKKKKKKLINNIN